MKKVIILLFVMLMTINVSAASCSSSELAKIQAEANAVKINQELIKEKIVAHKYDQEHFKYLDETEEQIKRSIKITVSGITENIFVVRTTLKLVGGTDANDPDGVIPGEEYVDEFAINYKMTKDGVYSFTTENVAEFIDYKFEVLSNNLSKPECDAIILRTISYRKPKYNILSENPICEDYPTSSLCQEFITTDINLNGKDFDTEVKKSSKSSTPTSTDKIEEKETKRESSNFFKDNILYIGIASGVIVAGIVAYVIVSKKRSAL